MKISKLKIHGIKSYEDVTIEIDDYTVFVGENNCGKSNILFCLLWFFGKEKLSSKDLNFKITDDPFIEVEFILMEGEDFSHPREYLVEGKFRVRGTIDRAKVLEKPVACEYFGYTGVNEESIKDTMLMGYKNVAKPSLGDIIYVPSVKSLSEELKFTATSSLNQLVSKYVINRIKDEDGKNNYYNQIVESIKQLSSFINEGENSALQRLKQDITKHMLDYNNVSLGFELEPPNAEDLIKSCFKQHTEVDGVANKLPLSSQGDGFQRSMIFSLIANLAELSKAKVSKKSAKNECTYYIIEEPEIFLHPNHQSYFRNKLEELSKNKDSQVILTSHSPYFLNNVANYSQIKRVYMDNGQSRIGEINSNEIDEICHSNGILIAEAKNECREVKYTSIELEAEANEIAKDDHLRYLLWIDPTRANAFLSQKVILVEGPTEKAFFSYLFNNPNGNFYNEKRTTSITIIDVVGKFHIYKFAQLLNKFKIKVWCIYDGDNDGQKHGMSHAKLNGAIENLKSNLIISGTLRLDPDIEGLLGVIKEHNKPDVGLYINLEKDINNCRTSDGYSKLVEFTRSIIET